MAIESTKGERKRTNGASDWMSRYANLVLDCLSEGVYGQDAEGKTLFVNPAAVKMLGHEPEKLMGEDMHNLVHHSKADGSAYPREECPSHVVYRTGEARHVENEVFWRKDGSSFPIEYTTTPIREDGKIIGTVVVFRDITDRRRAEEAGRASAAYARGLIEASLDALVTISQEGKITDVNKASEHLTGVLRERLIGSNFSGYFTEPEKAEKGYQQVLRQGLVKDYPLTIRDAEGGTTDVLYNAAVYRNEAGEVQGVFAAARDITERKRMEEAMARQATQEALARQAQEILEVSMPVVQVWEGVVLVPLIGTLDSQRTQQLMDRLLQRIVETNSSIALLDITGVPGIDTQTARHLVETVSAVNLLGAHVVLTGVRPAIAQTLVHLGIDLSSMVTRSSLTAGLGYALEMLNLQVAKSHG